MKAYPLRFPEKTPKGTKQGAKLPEVSKQGREISVFLAFSQYPSSIKQIEQDLRRRMIYPAELRRYIYSRLGVTHILQAKSVLIIIHHRGAFVKKYFFEFLQKGIYFWFGLCYNNCVRQKQHNICACSSVDRAPASGAGCVGSIPIRRTITGPVIDTMCRLPVRFILSRKTF